MSGALPNLVPRLFLSFLYKITGREPGRLHHVHDDVLCVVLCVVLVIELLPTHSLTTVSSIVLETC